MEHKIAICEDDPLFLAAIAERVSKYFEHNLIKCEIIQFTNGELLLSAIRYCMYDLVLLDTDTPQGNGMQLSRKLRAITNDTAIIYLSSNDSCVFESFRYSPLRFIRKKFWELEIDEALSAYMNNYLRNHPVYSFQSFYEYITIQISDIMYLEVYNHNVSIHLTNQVLTIRKPLNRLEEELNPYGFIRIHQSFLVSYRYIYSVLPACVVLTDQSTLPISRGKAQWVKDQLKHLLRK